MFCRKTSLLDFKARLVALPNHKPISSKGIVPSGIKIQRQFYQHALQIYQNRVSFLDVLHRLWKETSKL